MSSRTSIRGIFLSPVKGVSLVFSLLAAGIFLLASETVDADESKAEKAPGCVSPGYWRTPENTTNLNETSLLDRFAKRPVVILGESHTSAEHHRWQLHMLSALYGRNPNMVLGFEAFPRSLQPVLDRWTRGQLDEEKFLELTRWDEIWRFDPDLYMPLFHFARMHRLPMRALNVDREFIRRISREGWASIAVEQRQGIGDPLAPSKAYRESLEEVFGLHGEDDVKKDEKIELSDEEKKRFRSFVEVQTTWDRAMAEGIAAARTGGGDPLVVAIVGRGHVEYDYGIPHQLLDLGVKDAVVLLPWDKELPCEQLTSKEGVPIADVVFGIDAPPETKKPTHPMLGVQIENATGKGEKGVRIVKVVKNSVAASAGLKNDDLIIEAAGMIITQTQALVMTIRRQSPGTWLPLGILRDGKRLDIIAKFPLTSDQPKHP